MSDYFTNDVPKYRKKAKKVSSSRSNHKHIYEPCILINKNPKYTRYVYAHYCTICGKVGEIEYFKRINGERFCCNDEALLECYPTLPRFEVDDMFSSRLYIKNT